MDPRAAKLGEGKFWQRVATVGSGGCWQWIGGSSSHGYGIMSVWLGDRRSTISGHRWSYELFVGPVPEGLELDHLCRNRACVRPDHLEPVPHSVNIRRGVAAERWSAKAAAMESCRKGHPRTPETSLVYVAPDGYPRRVCRECRRESKRRSLMNRTAVS